MEDLIRGQKILTHARRPTNRAAITKPLKAQAAFLEEEMELLHEKIGLLQETICLLHECPKRKKWALS